MPELWGVINVTPDSFSDGGRYLDPSAAVDHGRRLLEEGADVLDVGGESSRPAGRTYGEGFDHVPAAEEIARVVPVIELLAGELAARVSIDTVKPEVAAAALAAGASIVNDVRCAEDPRLAEAAAAAGANYVIMHNRGRGEVRSPNTDYGDIVQDVIDELLQAAERVERAGVPRAAVWLDPGLGFAKTGRQSAALLSSLGRFRKTGYRVLVGPSRKSFIAELAPNRGGEPPSADDRLGGTAAAVAICVAAGVDAVRVHDVHVMSQLVRVAEALRAPPEGSL
ncbi:MAG: dihydropteroate synthase [Deltaproteobacteria bacterium]